MSDQARIAQVGHDPSFASGMSSVVAAMHDHAIGGENDVIVSWAPVSRWRQLGLAASATAALLQRDRRGLVHMHLSERGSFVREGGLIALAHRRGLATVATLHGADFEPFARQHPRLVRAVLCRCDVILTLSPSATRLVRALVPHATVQQIVNPVVVDETITPAGERPAHVVLAGELGHRKGVDVACAAWPAVRAAIPDARLTLIGPRTELAIPTLDGVEVLAPEPQQRVRERMREARLVILPSRAEVMPMVLLEATACGRPFIGTPVGDVGALAELGGGHLVEVDDAAGLASAMITILRDDALATTLGEAGHASCAEHFSIAAVDAMIRSAYALAREKGRRA